MTALAPQDRYRRLDLLGRGGMGEVFLADDLLLRRKVAIKVVHRTALANPRAEKLLRREAKAAAALDNPFICKVYEIGEDGGRVFIAMEYIQGETLRQRMQRGPIPTRDIVSIAREIADGLEEAGRKGVIHRDLKPSNIILTPQGHVKIMDFGLAKRLPSEEMSEESTGTPEGMVVGTREYMSPEQLRGKPLEPNSDLFALGLILYEMLCGVHPFKRASAIDTQFAILNEAPQDLHDAGAQAPDRLEELVHRLLMKAPADRPRIAELREKLADVSDTARPETRGSEKTVATSASVEAFVVQKPRVVLAMGTALVVIIAGLLLWVAFRPEPTMPQAKMATLITWPSNEDHAALSPDSKYVAFVSNRNGVKDIWLMDLAGGDPRRITNEPGELTGLIFSEDGSEIAYTLESSAQKLFQTVRLDGGPPTRSLALPNDTRSRRLVCWIGNDVFMETQTRDLVKLSLGSGAVDPVTTLPRLPRRPASYDVSRDGRHIVFSALHDDGSRSIWMQEMGGTARSLTPSGAVDGSPFFSDPVGKGRVFLESNRSGQEDLWFLERPGREPRQITFGSNREFIEAVSRDGRLIIFSEQQEGGSIFSYDSTTGVRSQLTAENTRDVTPTVTSGGRIAFARTLLVGPTPLVSTSIILGTLDGARLEETRMVVRDGFAPLLSPDGRLLAFMTRATGESPPHMNLLDVESGHVRDLGARLIQSLSYMDFAWAFVRRDFTWTARGVLFFTDTVDGVSARVMKLVPGAEPELVTTLAKGENPQNLVLNADGSRLFFVRAGATNSGGVVTEIYRGRVSSLFTATQGSLSVLGLSGEAVILALRNSANEPIEILSFEQGHPRRVASFTAVSNTWRFIPGLNAVTFSRRDAVDVENIFLVDLQSGKETPVTSNGIQGVAFSPVSDSGRGLLVFSQQLRNKDIGIIRLDSR